MTKIEFNQIRSLENVRLPFGANWTANFIKDMVNLTYTNTLYHLTEKQKQIIENLIYKFRKQIPDWDKLTAVREPAKREAKPLLTCGVFKREQRELPLFESIQNVTREKRINTSN